MSFHSQLTHKVSNASALKERLSSEGKAQVVFTNGCFDILHPGHVDYLCRARDLGDFLVVGLNTDNSVRRLEKGDDRPINNQHARATVLAGLACVDAIVLFDEDTPYDLIRLLEPHILVKGGDYTIDQIAGHDLVLARGGEVRVLPFVEGYSTTALVNRIRR